MNPNIPKFFQAIHYWPAYLLLKAVYRFEIQGQENLKGLEKSPVIFASNHASGAIDPPLCAISLPRNGFYPKDFFPVRFIAKKDVLANWRLRLPFFLSIFWLPVSFFSDLFVKLAGSILVTKGMGIEKNLENAIRALKEGSKLWIYPEGRVTLDGNIGPGRPGVFYLHQKTKAPIIPVGLSGTYKGLYPQNIIKGLLGFRKIKVRIGKPIYDLGDDTEKGVERVMEEIKKLLV